MDQKRCASCGRYHARDCANHPRNPEDGRIFGTDKTFRAASLFKLHKGWYQPRN